MQVHRDGAMLRLSGDFDVRHTAMVRRAIQEVMADHDDVVVLEVSGVTSIDLTALRVVGMATRLAARGGQRLLLRGCSPQVIRMLHLSRLIRVVQVERQRAA